MLIRFGWPNAAKLGPKSFQKSIQEGSWGCPGGSWGALGAKTEQGHEVSVFWGHLGAVLGASWGRLGAWIAVLGRLGPSWGPLEPS